MRQPQAEIWNTPSLGAAEGAAACQIRKSRSSGMNGHRGRTTVKAILRLPLGVLIFANRREQCRTCFCGLCFKLPKHSLAFFLICLDECLAAQTPLKRPRSPGRGRNSEHERDIFPSHPILFFAFLLAVFFSPFFFILW
jgi:hypothetical protein